MSAVSDSPKGFSGVSSDYMMVALSNLFIDTGSANFKESNPMSECHVDYYFDKIIQVIGWIQCEIMY